MEALINEAITVAGSLAIVISLVMQVTKQQITNKDYIAPIASVIGIGLGLLFGWYLGADLVVYGLAGLIGGLSSVGLYETTDKSAKLAKGDK